MLHFGHSKNNSLILILLLLLGALATANAKRPDLMPLPASIEWQTGSFRLTDTFKIAIQGNPDPRLYSAGTRTLRRLAGRTGLFLPQDFLQPGVTIDSPGMVIKCERPGKVEFGEDESYALVISPSQISLTAKTDLGALRGLETLLQTLAADDTGYFFPAVKIEDAPRFPWRGLMIDGARHFMPVDVIKRNVDGMAAVKLNVLHWHLSDDQGIRVESKIFPRLHELGSDGFYYTQAQIRDVIAYARERGIRVIPEFDVPGHATSWLVGYPELGSAPGPYQIERQWGIFYPVLNPVREFTYDFLDKFFGEMAELFPDAYFHIGGDEIEHGTTHVAKHWNENAEIQSFKKKNNIPDNAALQAYFNNRLLGILTKHGKIMIGWDEILHEKMPKDIVIQSWRGRGAMEKAAREGYQSILSNGYYIDLIQPTDSHYLNDPLPADAQLSEEHAKRILGGEATMWSEFVSPETIDSRIWPRTAAVAERFWSPRDVNDVDDMYRRLEKTSLLLEEHGLTHEKNFDFMLRRLAGGGDISALKNFVDVIEPVKIYTRNRLRRQTSTSPLTRVVDAARPDATVARDFRKTVDRYLTSKSDQDKTQIKDRLTLWKNNHTELQKLIKVSPVLVEIESLSQDLSEIATIALEALDRSSSGKAAWEVWKIEKTRVIERAKKPRGQTELMVVSAIEKLVGAAVQGSQ